MCVCRLPIILLLVGILNNMHASVALEDYNKQFNIVVFIRLERDFKIANGLIVWEKSSYDKSNCNIPDLKYALWYFHTN